MPTYEYQCLKCKKKFEKLQPMSAASVERCIRCGGKAERLISGGAGLIFKGSGFYITDYKKSGPADKGKGRGDPSGRPYASETKAADKPSKPAKETKKETKNEK